MNKTSTNKKGQGGYSLIEVMVSVLVMALGILGMTGLQSASIKHNAHSMQRTKAAYLSYEIMDRMRANAGSTYSVALNSQPAEQECFSSGCTPEELMNFDIAEWKCALGKHVSSSVCVTLSANANALLLSIEALPGGDGSISCTLNTGIKTCTVTVHWQERGNEAEAVKNQSFAVTSTI